MKPQGFRRETPGGSRGLTYARALCARACTRNTRDRVCTGARDRAILLIWKGYASCVRFYGERYPWGKIVPVRLN